MPKINLRGPSNRDADGPVVPRSEPAPAEPDAPSPSRPAQSADKAKWVAFAEAVGVDSSGSKAQIIKRVG